MTWKGFESLREISVDIIAHHTEIDKTIIRDLFANETGYATPKIDIRAVVFRDNKILMVKEKMDGDWSLPGGWGDIGFTPSEVAIKETKEESGFDVKAIKLISVFDKKCHPQPPSLYHVYKMFIQCEIIGGRAEEGMETNAVAFFAENELPSLSMARNTESQVKLAFGHLNNLHLPTYFD